MWEEVIINQLLSSGGVIRGRRSNSVQHVAIRPIMGKRDRRHRQNRNYITYRIFQHWEVRHFQVLHFSAFELFWSVIFWSCKFSAPATPPEENRATATTYMRKKLVKIGRVVSEISVRTDSQTDRQTNRRTTRLITILHSVTGICEVG